METIASHTKEEQTDRISAYRRIIEIIVLAIITAAIPLSLWMLSNQGLQEARLRLVETESALNCERIENIMKAQLVADENLSKQIALMRENLNRRFDNLENMFLRVSKTKQVEE